MIHLLPFQDAMEHEAYCSIAGLTFEDESVGFKFFDDEKKLGLCQLKFVGDAAYVLDLISFDEDLSDSHLANLFGEILAFLEMAGATGVVYPIQRSSDISVCHALGFDQVSDTLYVFDFPREEEECGEDHDCSCGCGHHHTH